MHAHTVVALSDGSTRGGYLMSTKVSIIAEVFVTDRTYDAPGKTAQENPRNFGGQTDVVSEETFLDAFTKKSADAAHESVLAKAPEAKVTSSSNQAKFRSSGRNMASAGLCSSAS